MMTAKYRRNHSKTHDLRSHFKRKLADRFKVRLNRFELKRLHEAFYERAILVRKDTNMKSWYYLQTFNQDIFLLFDTHRHEFITAYTLKMMIEASELKGLDFDSTMYKDP